MALEERPTLGLLPPVAPATPAATATAAPAGPPSPPLPRVKTVYRKTVRASASVESAWKAMWQKGRAPLSVNGFHGPCTLFTPAQYTYSHTMSRNSHQAMCPERVSMSALRVSAHEW